MFNKNDVTFERFLYFIRVYIVDTISELKEESKECNKKAKKLKEKADKDLTIEDIADTLLKDSEVTGGIVQLGKLLAQIESTLAMHPHLNKKMKKVVAEEKKKATYKEEK